MAETLQGASVSPLNISIGAALPVTADTDTDQVHDDLVAAAESVRGEMTRNNIGEDADVLQYDTGDESMDAILRLARGENPGNDVDIIRAEIGAPGEAYTVADNWFDALIDVNPATQFYDLSQTYEVLDDLLAPFREELPQPALGVDFADSITGLRFTDTPYEYRISYEEGMKRSNETLITVSRHADLDTEDIKADGIIEASFGEALTQLEDAFDTAFTEI